MCVHGCASMRLPFCHLNKSTKIFLLSHVPWLKVNMLSDLLERPTITMSTDLLASSTNLMWLPSSDWLTEWAESRVCVCEWSIAFNYIKQTLPSESWQLTITHNNWASTSCSWIVCRQMIAFFSYTHAHSLYLSQLQHTLALRVFSKCQLEFWLWFPLGLWLAWRWSEFFFLIHSVWGSDRATT